MPVRLYSMSCRYDNRPARESSLVCVVAIELIKPVIITNAFIFFSLLHFFIAFQTKKFSLENMHLLQKYPTPHIGLGVVPGERSFFHENERNDQERSHRSEKRKFDFLIHVLQQNYRSYEFTKSYQ